MMKYKIIFGICMLFLLAGCADSMYDDIKVLQNCTIQEYNSCMDCCVKINDGVVVSRWSNEVRYKNCKIECHQQTIKDTKNGKR